MRAIEKPGPFGLTGGWAKAVWVVSVLSALALAWSNVVDLVEVMSRLAGHVGRFPDGPLQLQA